MTLEIQVLAWDRHRNMEGLKRFIGSQPSPIDNWMFKDTIDINKMNCELMLTYDTPAYMFNVYKNQLSR